MNYYKLRLALRPEDPLQIQKKAVLNFKRDLLKDVLKKNTIQLKKEPSLTQYIQEEVYNKGTYLSIKHDKFYEKVNTIELQTEVKTRSKFGLKFGVAKYDVNQRNIYGVPLSGDSDYQTKYKKFCTNHIIQNNFVPIRHDESAETSDVEKFVGDLQFYEPLYQRDKIGIVLSIKKLGVLTKEPEKEYIEFILAKT